MMTHHEYSQSTLHRLTGIKDLYEDDLSGISHTCTHFSIPARLSFIKQADTYGSSKLGESSSTYGSIAAPTLSTELEPDIDRQFCKDRMRFQLLKAILLNDVDTVKAFFNEKCNILLINQPFGNFLVFKDRRQGQQSDVFSVLPNHTPLTLATTLGCFEGVKYLVSCGADVESPMADGLTSLHIACRDNHCEIVEYLINLCKASVNRCSTDGSLVTPLMLAALHGRTSVLCLLLTKGANVDQSDKFGRTAIFHSLRSGSLHCLNALVQHGGNVNYRDVKGSSLLHYLYSKHVDISSQARMSLLEYLINRCGLSTEFVQDNGSTAFHKAVKKGTVKEVKYFIDNGACVNATKKGWETPIWVALTGQGVELNKVKTLLAHGADVSSFSNSNGMSILDYVVQVLENDELAQLVMRAIDNNNHAKAQPQSRQLVNDESIVHEVSEVIPKLESAELTEEISSFRQPYGEPPSRFVNSGGGSNIPENLPFVFSPDNMEVIFHQLCLNTIHIAEQFRNLPPSTLASLDRMITTVAYYYYYYYSFIHDKAL